MLTSMFDSSFATSHVLIPAGNGSLGTRCRWWRRVLRRSHRLEPIMGRLLATVGERRGEPWRVEDRDVPMVRCRYCRRSETMHDITVPREPGDAAECYVGGVALYDRPLSPDEVDSLYAAFRAAG